MDVVRNGRCDECGATPRLLIGVAIEGQLCRRCLTVALDKINEAYSEISEAFKAKVELLAREANIERMD